MVVAVTSRKKHQVLVRCCWLSLSCRSPVVAKYYVKMDHCSQIPDLINITDFRCVRVQLIWQDQARCEAWQPGDLETAPGPTCGLWVTCVVMCHVPLLHDFLHQQSLSWIFYSQSAQLDCQARPGPKVKAWILFIFISAFYYFFVFYVPTNHLTSRSIAMSDFQNRLFRRKNWI